MVVGHVLILTEYYDTQLGGRLWWRRWPPDRELAVSLVETIDGSSFDNPLDDSEMEAELHHWSHNHFPLLWALTSARGIYGVTACFDNDGHIIWSFADEP